MSTALTIADVERIAALAQLELFKYAPASQETGVRLGVVVRAKKNIHVDRARPLVQELIAAGMCLEGTFVDRALESIGE